MSDLEALQRSLWDNEDSTADKLNQWKKAPLLKYAVAAFVVGLTLNLIVGDSSDVLNFLTMLIQMSGLAFAGWWMTSMLKLQSQQAQHSLMIWQQIKQTIISNCDYVSQYEAKPDFPEKTYRDSQIFPNAPANEFGAQDSTTGKYNNVAYRIIELTVANRVKRRKNGKTKVEYTLVYSGLLFAAKFNKRMDDVTLVTTDTVESMFGDLARSAQRVLSSGSKLQLVELEDPHFEASFAVRASDPVEARYIMSLAFMEKLLSLKETLGTDIQLIFKGEKLLMSIPTSTNFLDTHWHERDGQKQAQLLQNDLLNVLSTIDHLQIDENVYASGRVNGNFL